MKFNELPQEIQDSLNAEAKALREKNRNTPYEVLLYNEKGTRYFMARRNAIGTTWGSFGGGSEWKCSYGKVQFQRRRDPLGGIEYVLTEGQRFAHSANGTEIPEKVATKKEVIDIINRIGIFGII